MFTPLEKKLLDLNFVVKILGKVVSSNSFGALENVLKNFSTIMEWLLKLEEPGLRTNAA